MLFSYKSHSAFYLNSSILDFSCVFFFSVNGHIMLCCPCIFPFSVDLPLLCRKKTSFMQLLFCLQVGARFQNTHLLHSPPIPVSRMQFYWQLCDADTEEKAQMMGQKGSTSTAFFLSSLLFHSHLTNYI